VGRVSDYPVFHEPEQTKSPAEAGLDGWNVAGAAVSSTEVMQ